MAHPHILIRSCGWYDHGQPLVIGFMSAGPAQEEKALLRVDAVLSLFLAVLDANVVLFVGVADVHANRGSQVAPVLLQLLLRLRTHLRAPPAFLAVRVPPAPLRVDRSVDLPASHGADA